MKTKHYLLPHRWQTAGWILLAVVFVVVNLLFGFDVWSVMDEAAFKLLIAAVYVIIGVSLLMIAFSEERQEDEFIRSLRGRSLAAAACVAFVLSVIWFCVSGINLMYFPMHEADDTKRWVFYMVDNYLSVLPMFFLYIVIFKVSLWINRRRCRHEE